MTHKQIFNTMIAFLLVFMVIVSPTLAAEPKDEITIKRADDNINVRDLDDSKLYSDDKFLGFDRKHNYDPFQDISLQNAIDLAASLPVWWLAIVAILLLSISTVVVYIAVIGWNTLKGGKAAVNENPVKAAQGIKDTKMVNRAYTGEVVEAVIYVAFVVFVATLFM